MTYSTETQDDAAFIIVFIDCSEDCDEDGVCPDWILN